MPPSPRLAAPHSGHLIGANGMRTARHGQRNAGIIFRLKTAHPKIIVWCFAPIAGGLLLRSILVKLEIEITEDEIRSAIERKVRTAIADQTNNYATDTYIRDQVKANWRTAVDNLIVEEMYNSQALREKIAVEIEKKLRLQLAAAIKNSSAKSNIELL